MRRRILITSSIVVALTCNAADDNNDHSGIYNVRHYGAVGDGMTDDSGAIQTAIDETKGTPGGEIYFPAGSYHVASTIYIPRLSNGSISIVGAGMFATTVGDRAGALAVGEPVFDFTPFPEKTCEKNSCCPGRYDCNHSEGYVIRDLSIVRETNEGPLLRHTKTMEPPPDPTEPPSPPPFLRFHQSVIRNVKFTAPPSDKYDAVTIQGGLNCVIDNVRIGGGDSALVLQDSSHCLISNVAQGADGGRSHNGMRVIGGGTHTIRMFRTDNIDGTVLSLEAGVTSLGSIVIDRVVNEGKDTQYVLQIVGNPGHLVENIQVTHLGIAQPCQVALDKCTQNPPPDAFGLYVNDYARNIHIEGGTIASWGDHVGNPIYIAAGAENVLVEGMYSVATPPNYNASTIANVAAGAKDVRVRFTDPLDRDWEVEEGVVGVLTPVNSNQAFVETRKTMVANITSTERINEIRQNIDPTNSGLFTDVPKGSVLTVLGSGSQHGTKLVDKDDNSILGGNLQLSE